MLASGAVNRGGWRQTHRESFLCKDEGPPLPPEALWRDGRVVEGGGLENR